MFKSGERVRVTAGNHVGRVGVLRYVTQASHASGWYEVQLEEGVGLVRIRGAALTPDVESYVGPHTRQYHVRMRETTTDAWGPPWTYDDPVDAGMKIGQKLREIELRNAHKAQVTLEITDALDVTVIEVRHYGFGAE